MKWSQSAVLCAAAKVQIYNKTSAQKVVDNAVIKGYSSRVYRSKAASYIELVGHSIKFNNYEKICGCKKESGEACLLGKILDHETENRYASTPKECSNSISSYKQQKHESTL